MSCRQSEKYSRQTICHAERHTGRSYRQFVKETDGQIGQTDAISCRETDR